MNTPNSDRCQTCLYWRTEQSHVTVGECHRYPPSVDLTFPETVSTEWCGEWVQKQFAANQRF